MCKLKKALKIFSIFILASAFLLSIGVGALYVYASKNTSSVLDESLFEMSKGQTLTRLYYNTDAGGEYVPVEYAALTPSGVKKLWCEYGEMSDNLKNAFIAAEDRDFYTHPGFNMGRTIYALLNSIFHFKSDFGASTITQQVIKNISGDNEKTVKRKLNEIIRAVNIEKNHTKNEILELYLNIVPMGDNIVGVGLASEYYFGKSSSELKLEEAALLAAVTNSPAKYNPYDHPQEAKRKRNVVLYAMRECGYISDAEYESAISSPIVLSERRSPTDSVNSWFTEMVLDDVCADLTRNLGLTESAARLMCMSGGLSIYTTLNPEVQNILENYFEDTSNFPSEVVSGGLDFSMIVTDSLTGYVVGVVGNVGKKTENRILNYASTLHPPGSTLKPLSLYAPLLEEGRINWANVFDDVPINVSEGEGGYIYYPRNSPNVYSGLITVKDALRLSKNTVAVRLYNLLGKEKIYRNLTENYGFRSIIRSEVLDDGRKLTDLDVSPLALGQLSYGVSLRSLVGAYSVFVSEGLVRSPKSYLSVYDSKGELILENTEREKRVLSADTAKIMNMLLSEVVDSGTAKRITLKYNVDTAGKTGTSSGDMDRLFVGYTPYFTAGIWCGYEGENKSIGEIEIGHLDIWDEVMREIHNRICRDNEMRGFDTSGLLYLPYCMDSGGIYTEACQFDLRFSRMDYGYFTKDNCPTEECRVHVLCLCDAETKIPVHGDAHGKDFVFISYLDIKRDEKLKNVIIADRDYSLEILNYQFNNNYFDNRVFYKRKRR